MNMNELTVVKGIIEDLERSTDVHGTGNRTSTTHLSIFTVDTQRVILRTSTPGVLASGDNVALAGTRSNGQFHALACNNTTANWISPLKQQGCAFSALIGMSIVSLLLFFMVIPIIFGGACIFFAVKVRKRDNTLKKAHQMILDA